MRAGTLDARVERRPRKKKVAATLKLSEEQIDEILDRFIAKYFAATSRFVDAGVDACLDRLREYLRANKFENFADSDDFAEKLVGEMQSALGSSWSNSAAVNAIKRTTKGIYEFYRLKDTSNFADGKSPVRLRLGGADTKSVKFFGELDHFYFSKFADNTQTSLKQFFADAYLQNGAALFGRETSEELADFRAAAGEKLKNLTDRSVKGIVSTSVQRVRNWAHIGSLSQARIELSRIVATLDARTTELCRELDGKQIRVGVAQSAIERLNQLEPGEFAAELYESKIGKAISQEPVATIKKFLEPDGVTVGDALVKMGRGFPPFHVNCRTRLEGIIAGAANEKR